MHEEPTPKETPKKPVDLSEMFDLSRDKAVARYVDGFEDLLRQKDAIQQDIKELAGQAKESMFTPVEIKAMQDIAKWRKDDKGGPAAEKLAALKRVGRAAKFDLFSWADAAKAS